MLLDRGLPALGICIPGQSFRRFWMLPARYQAAGHYSKSRSYQSEYLYTKLALLEKIAASLPVVASNVPAHADLVRHGGTGWLVSDRTELVEVLMAVEDPAAAEHAGTAAREQVRRELGTWDSCSVRYAAASCRPLEEGNSGCAPLSMAVVVAYHPDADFEDR